MGVGTDMFTVTQKEGFNYLEDRVTIGTGYPPLDLTQGGTDDLLLVDFILTTDKKEIQFKRKRQTGDDLHDVELMENENYILLYAWGNSTHLSYHGQENRGRTTIQLISFENYEGFSAFICIMAVALFF